MATSTHRNVSKTLATGRVAACVLALAALVFGSPQMTGGSVAAAFRGEWVPAKALCTSPLKVVIEANVVTFVKGTDRAEFRNLDQCFTCAGHDVENVTLLSTDAMGDSPFTLYLDGRKKTPRVEALYNDKKLAARFPFGKASLKKCK